MRTNPYERIELPAGLASSEDLKSFLGEIERCQSFDDINIAGERFVIIKSNASVYRVGRRVLRKAEVETIANLIGKGANVSSDVYGGNQLDEAYQFTYEEREVYRYRVNISAIRDGGDQQIKIGMRSIKTDIPSLDYVRIEEDQFNFMMNGGGLVIISGETGSGKTTTLAGVIGHVIRGRELERVICCYEHPVEYEYQPLITEIISSGEICPVEVYQHEIGSDLPSFIEGTRNAFRSNPDIIILGEARDRVTIDAALVLAQSGHLVFITTHAKGVTNSISRLVSTFPVEQQSAALLGFLTTTKYIISQQLLKTESGTRIPVREQLKITESIQRQFGQCNSGELNASFTKLFEDQGETFSKCAERLYENNEISQNDLNNIISREKAL